MTESVNQPTSRSVRSEQGLLFLGLLLAIALPHVLVQIATHQDWILLRSRLPQWKATNRIYIDNRFYDGGDGTLRLLYDVLPKADYSRGGVYFIGSSRFANGLPLWECSANEQQLIHNYAIGASTHIQQGQFLRYLIDKKDLLKAGSNKTMVLFDLFFGSAGHQVTLQAGEPPGLFRYDFARYGIFNYDINQGVDDVLMSSPERLFRDLKLHDDAFWWWGYRILHRTNLGYLDGGKSPTPQLWRQQRLKLMGPDWPAGMDLELRAFSKTVDYLQSRGVLVVGVFMPQGSWFDNFEPAINYRAKVSAMLQEKKVQIVDLAHAVPDEGLGDSAHLNYTGVHEVLPQLLKIPREFLRGLD